MMTQKDIIQHVLEGNTLINMHGQEITYSESSSKFLLNGGTFDINTANPKGKWKVKVKPEYYYKFIKKSTSGGGDSTIIVSKDMWKLGNKRYKAQEGWEAVESSKCTWEELRGENNE